MRSIYDNVATSGFAAAFNTLGATVCTGGSVDTKGYSTGVLRVFTSTVASGIAVGNGASLTAVLQESTDGTTWSTATDNTGATIGGTQTATTSAVITSYRIEGLNLNRDRYLRVVTTAAFGGAVSNNSKAFTSAAVIELGRSYQRPVDTTVSNT